MVYDHLLVQDHIALECAITGVSNPMNRSRDERDLREQYPLRHPCVGRSTWRVPFADFYQHSWSSWPPTRPAVEGEFSMTYQAAKGRPLLYLQVMLGCKQLYVEAREIFYSRNTFSFTRDFRILTALHFLQDRPAASLSRVFSLELALMEDGPPLNEPRYTLSLDRHGFFPSEPDSGNCYLVYAYDYYPRLCSLLASSAMQLRDLRLVMESYHLLQERNPISIEQCLSVEERSPSGVPSWLNPLLELTGLHAVSVRWTSSWPFLRRTARCLDLLRHRMLLDGCAQGETTAPVSGGEIADVRVRMLATNNESEVDIGAAMSYSAVTDQLSWRVCGLRFDGTRLVEAREDADETEIKTDQQFLRELRQGHGSFVTTCFWESSRTQPN